MVLDAVRSYQAQHGNVQPASNEAFSPGPGHKGYQIQSPFDARNFGLRFDATDLLECLMSAQERGQGFGINQGRYGRLNPNPVPNMIPNPGPQVAPRRQLPQTNQQFTDNIVNFKMLLNNNPQIKNRIQLFSLYERQFLQILGQLDQGRGPSYEDAVNYLNVNALYGRDLETERAGEHFLQRLKEGAPLDEARGLSASRAPAHEASVTEQVAGLAEAAGVFVRAAVAEARQLVRELPLLAHERAMSDPEVERDFGHYMRTAYGVQLQGFLAAAQQYGQFGDLNPFERQMAKLGPVHGCLSLYAPQVYEEVLEHLAKPGFQIGQTYEKVQKVQSQVINQGFDEVEYLRKLAASVASSQGPVQTESLQNTALGRSDGVEELSGSVSVTIQTNGFPGEDFEHYAGVALEQIPQPEVLFPNQPPPVYRHRSEASQIHYRFVTNRRLHQKLNFRRDSLSLALEDFALTQQARNELNAARFLGKMYALQKTQYRPNIAALITYIGFSVFCENDLEDQQQVYGYDKNNVFINQVGDKLENLSDLLNVEAQMSRITKSQTLRHGRLLGSGTNVQQLLNLMCSDLESAREHIVAALIQQYKRDLVDQLPTLNNVTLRDAQLTYLNQFCSIYSGDIITGLGQVLMKDLPTQFIAVLGGLSIEQQNKAIRENYRRLPLRFTQSLDEKVFTELYTSFDQKEDMHQQQGETHADILQDLASQLYKMAESIRDNQETFNTRLLLDYIGQKLIQTMQQNAYKQAMRWSDIYRVQYLPMLMQIIESKIMNGQLEINEIAGVFERLEVPEYLWMYCANFTQYEELFETVKLETIAVAASEYLNIMLRRKIRNVQQFGLQSTVFYGGQYSLQDLKQMIMSGQITQEEVDYYTQDKVRLNYFTGDQSTRNTLFTRAIIQLIVDFFNDLFGHSTTVADFYEEFDAFFYKFYHAPAFGEQYTEVVNAALSNRYAQRTAKAVYEHLTPQNLFTKHTSARKLYLLQKIASRSGIHITDSPDIAEKPIHQSDIRGFYPIITSVTSGLLDLHNVPYDKLRDITERIEDELLTQFSVKYTQQKAVQNPQNSMTQDQLVDSQGNFKDGALLAGTQSTLSHTQKQTNVQTEVAEKAQYLPLEHHYTYENYIYRVQNSLITQRSVVGRSDSRQLNLVEVSKSLHYALQYYGDLQDCHDGTFSYIIADLSEAVLLSRYDDPAVLVQKMLLQKLFQAVVNVLTRHNGQDGARLYRHHYKLLQTQESLIDQLPEEARVVVRQSLENQKNICNKFLPQSLEEAQRLAEQATNSAFGLNSFQCGRLNLENAAAEYRQGPSHISACNEFSAKAQHGLLNFGEDSRPYGELLHVRALVARDSGRLAEAVNLIERSVKCFWRDVDRIQVDLTQLLQLNEQLAQRYHVSRVAANDVDMQSSRVPELVLTQTTKSINGQDNAHNEQQGTVENTIKLNNYELPQNIIQAGARVVIDTGLNAEQNYSDLFLSTNQYLTISPQNQAVITEAAIRHLRVRINLLQGKQNETRLILSELYSAQAAILQRLASADRNHLINAKKLAVEALKIRGKILSRDHPYSLAALRQVAQADLATQELNNAAAALEFVLQNLLKWRKKWFQHRLNYDWVINVADLESSVINADPYIPSQPVDPKSPKSPQFAKDYEIKKQQQKYWQQSVQAVTNPADYLPDTQLGPDRDHTQQDPADTYRSLLECTLAGLIPADLRTIEILRQQNIQLNPSVLFNAIQESLSAQSVQEYVVELFRMVREENNQMAREYLSALLKIAQGGVASYMSIEQIEKYTKQTGNSNVQLLVLGLHNPQIGLSNTLTQGGYID